MFLATATACSLSVLPKRLSNMPPISPSVMILVRERRRRIKKMKQGYDDTPTLFPLKTHYPHTPSLWVVSPKDYQQLESTHL
jgi:hypothetical protein